MNYELLGVLEATREGLQEYIASHQLTREEAALLKSIINLSTAAIALEEEPDEED